MAVVVGNVSKLLSSRPVHRIFKAWVVCIQFGSIAENLIGESVQLLNGPWEPGHCVLFLVSGKLMDSGTNVVPQALDDAAQDGLATLIQIGEKLILIFV